MPKFEVAISISIHAPGGGATDQGPVTVDGQTDFNPRTRVGCDRKMRRSTGIRNDFNPRTRVGCDLSSKYTVQCVSSISIHAPGWGATLRAQPIISPAVFQSTHPGGVRPRSPSERGHHTDFNPRTRVGCDGKAVYVPAPASRFQSTHPGGVRLDVDFTSISQWQFQSTHPGGVRPGR